MIQKVQIAAWLVTVAAPAWVLGSIAWQALAGGGKLEVLMLAVWLFLGAAMVRLSLWVALKMRRPA